MGAILYIPPLEQTMKHATTVSRRCKTIGVKRQQQEQWDQEQLGSTTMLEPNLRPPLVLGQEVERLDAEHPRDADHSNDHKKHLQDTLQKNTRQPNTQSDLSR